jgi:hypothetical protein
MALREASFALGGAFVSALLVLGVWSLQPSPKAPPPPPAEPPPLEDEALRSANENLIRSLHECDRALLSARAHAPPAAVASATPSAASARPTELPAPPRTMEPSKEELEGFAERGVVRVRAPCLLDKPWMPSSRSLDRLGLAPHDADSIHEVFERSNRRLGADILPLCSRVLGGAKVAVRIGPRVCADAIMNWARDADPEGTKAVLRRVAEANAGRRELTASPDAPAVEQLLVAMAREMKAFESDLASSFGPEEARRLAWAPEMCAYSASMRGDGL